MDLRRAIGSVLLSLSAIVLSEFLRVSKQISAIDTGVFSNIWVRGVIGTVILSLVIYGILSLIIRLRKNRREKNAPPFFTASQKPKKIFYKAEIQEFGVTWKGLYGTLRDLPTSSINDAYVYVEGPYCPDDDTKLKSRTVSKWVFFDETAWVCPHCDCAYSRSTTHYLDEDGVVEDKFERIFEERL